MNNDSGAPCPRLLNALLELLTITEALLTLCELVAVAFMETATMYRTTVYLAVAMALGAIGTLWCGAKRVKNWQLSEVSHRHRPHAELLHSICTEPQCVPVVNSLLTLIILAGLSWTSYGAVTLGDCACRADVSAATCGVWNVCLLALVLVVLRFCCWTAELCWLLCLLCRLRDGSVNRADYEHLQADV